jgi:hypothetical protein
VLHAANVAPLLHREKTVDACLWGGGTTILGLAFASRPRPYNQGITTVVLVIIIAVVFVVPLLVVAASFVWAAKRDGEEDRALQARLGIRRRTRLGR